MRPLFQIKICGITTPTDAIMACESGADALGINFYQRSPRFVDTELATEIAVAVDKYKFVENRHVWKIGVFVNSTAEEIRSRVVDCRLDAIQFHGDEEAGIIDNFRELTRNQNVGLHLIRAIRIDAEASNQSFDKSTAQHEIDEWVAAGVNAILLDAVATKGYGGTGRSFDWTLIAGLECSVPMVLAGGLNPENVADAIRISGLKSVDVASGVESQPGVKDNGKLTAFIALCRSSFGQ